MRNLASIVSVKNVIPMDGKDRIVCVTFNENGYECIVPKENATPGNILVFIQEGSILPQVPQWEFLRKRCWNENEQGFVIKPMTMGKKADGTRVKSWGLAVTPSEAGLEGEFKPGDDVTSLLSIRKYEPEEKPCDDGRKKPSWVSFCMKHRSLRWLGNLYFKLKRPESIDFPSHIISKSDETTIQNMGEQFLLDHIKDEVYVTAKLEGQSVTALFDYSHGHIGRFMVCSRSRAYIKGDNDFIRTAKRLGVKKRMLAYYRKTRILPVIQAEQCGPGIQSNIYNLEEIDWYVYTIKDGMTGRQLTLPEMLEACDFMRLHHVPLLTPYHGDKMLHMFKDMKECVAYAEDKFWKPTPFVVPNYLHVPHNTEKLWKDFFQHEGIVVRSMDYDKDNGKGFSFKVKNLAYSEQGLGKIHDAAHKVLISMENN